jgi:riboflavin kinase/FMN adenylyltransferase
MIIFDGTKEIEYEGRTRVAIGKFDGIHKGHQKLISIITDKTIDSDKSLVFTFTYKSEYYLNKVERIFSEEERRKKFEALGVDFLVEYELNDETSRMEPEDFARVILKERLHAKEIVCGPDLSFGYKGRGNVELLRSMAEELDLKITVIEKVQYEGEDISSSRIRNALKEGHEYDAKVMLGD